MLFFSLVSGAGVPTLAAERELGAKHLGGCYITGEKARAERGVPATRQVLTSSRTSVCYVKYLPYHKSVTKIPR